MKPVVIGQFGAYKYAYPTPVDAERVLRSVEADSCPFGIDGWAHWSWDTTEWGTGELPLWEGSASGFLIDQALGPRLRPDPCAAVPGAGNLALGKPATASAELPEAPATRAVDGLMANWWASGGYPYQWIDIDLGAPRLDRAGPAVREPVPGRADDAPDPHSRDDPRPLGSPARVHRRDGRQPGARALAADRVDERQIRPRGDDFERVLGLLEGNRALRTLKTCPGTVP